MWFVIICVFVFLCGCGLLRNVLCDAAWFILLRVVGV